MNSFNFNIFTLGMRHPYKIHIPKETFTQSLDLSKLQDGTSKVVEGDGWEGYVVKEGNQVGVKIKETLLFGEYSQTIWI